MKFSTYLTSLLIPFCLAGPVAFAQEDSCMSAIRWEPDGNDPMMIHFCFNGTTPPGSFAYNCVWNFGDGNTSTDSFAVHTYAQPGTYTVCMEFSICIGGGLSCHDDTCITISVGNISGIAGITGLANFILYPNPAKDDLHLRVNTVNETVTAIVLNTAGAEIKKIFFTGTDSAIPVTDLSPGLYYMQVTAGSQTLSRKFSVE